MDYKNNDRVIEVRTSYALNRIYNYVNRRNFKEHMLVLEALVETIDEDNKNRFLELVKNSCNEQILGASKKEILFSFQSIYEKPTEIAEHLGLSRSYYYNLYKELLARNYATDTFKESLKPKLDKDSIQMCVVINSFIDSMDYLTGDDFYPYYDAFRSLELEFWIIYKKIESVLTDVTLIDKFMFKLCALLEIDINTINYLLRNITTIERMNSNQISGRQQFRQEVFNMFYLKGFTKGEVGKNIFGREAKAYYSKSYDKTTKNITNNEWEFNLTYTPTLDWAHIDKLEVLKVINLFKSFVNAKL